MNRPPLSRTKPAAPCPDCGADEYLTFQVGDAEYGVGILAVQEIRCIPTAVAAAPAETPEPLDSVTGPHGESVPIVDMRVPHSAVETRGDQFAVLIILTIAGRLLGIAVDGVADVVRVADAERRPAPLAAQSTFSPTCITGLAGIGDRKLTLIDIERLMICSPASNGTTAIQ